MTMLSSLRIANFRLFKTLILKECGRANLIVGKNNSGKTCLLEALRIYQSPGDLTLLARLVRARREDLDALGPLDMGAETRTEEVIQNNPLRNLFYGYELPFGDDGAIEIGPLDDSGHGTVRIAPAIYAFQSDADGNRVRRRKDEQSLDKYDEQEDVVYMESTLRERDSDRPFPTRALSSFFDRPYGRRSVGPLRQDNVDLGVRFVAARPDEDDDGPLLEDWGRVSIRPQRRGYVLKALQIIDPEIREIVMVPAVDRRYRARDQFVLVYDDNKRLSLASLGDGTRRLFEIAVAVAATTKSVVLFDEFENGLHWSVQPLAWKLLLEIARDLDVQIFATTHSWDCVKAFQTVIEEENESGILFHLGKSIRTSDHGQVIVTTYSGERLKAATRAGLEVR